MVQLSNQVEELGKEFHSANLNLQALVKQEQLIKVLPADKVALKKSLGTKVADLKVKLSAASAALEKHREEVESLHSQGKISSSGLVYPGAKVIIKDVELDIIREYNSVTFVRDGNLIRPIKYEEIEEEEFIKRT